MTLGKAVLQIRKELGLTQSEVARRSRLATSYVSRIENNHIRPTMATLGRLAEALDVPISSIFRITESGAPVRVHRCPVSASGDCIGEQIRSARGRPPREKKAAYGDEELRLLKMTDFLALRGSKEVRRTLAIVLESLLARTNQAPGAGRPGSG
jgi:transcriptional regulator with XRE-family HTH domain